MSADYTVDGLITDVRESANISPNTEDGADDRILRLLNRQQTTYITNLLQKAAGKHRRRTFDVLTSAGEDAGNGRIAFNIPQRAIAAGIVRLEGIDANGGTWMLFEEEQGNWWPRNGSFYVQANQLIFYRTPPTGTLRFTYGVRLSTLVMEADVGIITNINRGTGVIAISPTPTGFGTAAALYDFVKSTPHFDLYAMDKSATRSSGNMTFAVSDIPADVVVGDHICAAGETAVCQAPEVMHDLLALRTAYRWTKAKNDSIAAELAKVLYGEDGKSGEQEAVTKLLEPRIEDEARLLNPYAPGWRNPPYSRRVR